MVANRELSADDALKDVIKNNALVLRTNTPKAAALALTASGDDDATAEVKRLGAAVARAHANLRADERDLAEIVGTARGGGVDARVPLLIELVKGGVEAVATSEHLKQVGRKTNRFCTCLTTNPYHPRA